MTTDPPFAAPRPALTGPSRSSSGLAPYRPGLALLVAGLAILAAAALPGPANAQACVEPSRVTDADGDFRRMAGQLGNVCITQHEFTEHGVMWIVHWVDSRRPGPHWVVLHDDENAAFDAAVQGLAAHGGTLSAVETGGQRAHAGVDPNRNFANRNAGCARTPATARFVEAIMHGWSGGKVISLHTNARGIAATGGAGTVSIERPFSNAFSLKGAKAPNEDTMVILATRQGSQQQPPSKAASLQARGMNVMVEVVPDPLHGDCSMSNFAVGNNMDYYNLEARNGDRGGLLGMIAAVAGG